MSLLSVTSPDVTGSPVESHAVGVVRALYEALSTGDVPGVIARLAPDVIVDEPSVLPYGGVHAGRDDFLQSVLGTMMSAAEVALTDFTLFDGPNDTVVGKLVGSLTARTTGERFPLTMIEIHQVVGDVSRSVDVFLKDPADLAGFYARNAQAAA